MKTVKPRGESTHHFEPDFDNPRRLLKICPAYNTTPLVKVSGRLGGKISIKNESNRMGLGSFKSLGGVYAVAMLILQRCEEQIGKDLVPEDLVSPQLKALARSITFVCASAGNHGLAVAAGARLFGANARVYLSQQVPRVFEDRLLTKSAEVIRSGRTYEESVTAAMDDVESTDAILLADSSWPGYTKPPSLVMEGYTVVAEELRGVFEQNNAWPSHVYLQAGVGGLAGAMTHMIRANWSIQPRIIIVEPNAAACLQASHRAGRIVRDDGPTTNMGRLDCKEPSIIAHAILERSDVEFISISDGEAAEAAAFLQVRGLPTTPSGAAGLAGLWRSRRSYGSDEKFEPLIFVTENAESAS